MSGQLWVWLAFGISGIAFTACIWQLVNMRGYKSRGRRRAPSPPQENRNQRQGDMRSFGTQERKLYTEAQRLLGQGSVVPAARIFEQLGMQREAIQAFEDAGLVHEAAKILMRMQRHNRAGVIYARHGMWDHAAQSFKIANMPLEAAKCAREAGNFDMAAEYFTKIQRYEDAAECMEQKGDYQRAARLFTSAGQKDRAMQLYNKLAKTSENIANIEFHEEEIKQIVDYLGDGRTAPGLADVVVSKNRLTDVVLNLMSKGLTKQASELFLRATSDIGPMLMAEINYQDRSAATLAEVFLAVSNFHYAGMIFERMGSFEQAGHAFEQAEDFERASYCFERAGQDAKAKILKERSKTTPYRGRASSSSFALAHVSGSSPQLDTATNNSIDETTSAVQLSAASSPPKTQAKNQSSNQEPYPAAPHPMGRFVMDADGPSNKQDALKNSKDDQGHDEKRGNDDELPPIKNQMPESAQVTLDEGRSSFHKAKFFADLDFEQKNKLWSVGLTQHYTEGATVLTYNDEPRGIYVIIHGSVSCYRQVGSKEAYVDQMGESETFGELWLLADQPTAVRFVASKETKIRMVSREAFNSVLDKDGTIARKVYKRFTMRLLKRLLNQQNESKISNAS